MAFNETELLKVLTGADIREQVRENLVSLRWARVTSLDPLEVRRDGETSDITVTGTAIPIEVLRVGDRVRVSNYGAVAFIESSWDASSRTETAIVDVVDSVDQVIDSVDQVIDDVDQAKADVSEAFGMASDATIVAQDAHNAAVAAEQLARKAAPVVRIDSSNGVLFKSNLVSTVLSVTIFRADRIVVDVVDMWDVFGPTAYIEWQWKRFGDADYSTISSADPRVGSGGFTLTLTPEDVDTKVVFRAILNGE